MGKWIVGLVVVMGVAGWGWAAETRPVLKEELGRLKVPPEWFATTEAKWDTNKPWKDARLEIRRLMGLGEQENREAVKLTWTYARKGDIGDGHELPMYLFMSGNYAWATVEYPKYLAKVEGNGGAHAQLCYASCLAHFGEYEAALKVIEKAKTDLPKPPWRINAEANIANELGDLYVKMGRIEEGKAAYREAMRLYPTSNQPYGRHLLPRQVGKVKTKLDLLTFDSLGSAKLRDGVYTGRSLGFVDGKDVVVRVTIRGGKMADIQVTHEEKIELNATKTVPAAIIAKQSLKVDAVTGATITSQAIVDGTYQALKAAGLK